MNSTNIYCYTGSIALCDMHACIRSSLYMGHPAKLHLEKQQTSTNSCSNNSRAQVRRLCTRRSLYVAQPSYVLKGSIALPTSVRTKTEKPALNVTCMHELSAYKGRLAKLQTQLS